MMEEMQPAKTFQAEVVMRRGKEGRSAYLTIPPPTRSLLGLRGGEILTLSVLRVDDPAPVEREKKK